MSRNELDALLEQGVSIAKIADTFLVIMPDPDYDEHETWNQLFDEAFDESEDLVTIGW